MNVTLRQLHAFVLGAEAASFSMAAARMGITQPGYSLLIGQLETALGVRVFQRTTRRVQLTQAGQELLQGAQRTLQQVDETCRRAADLRDLRQGTLRIAVVPSVACSLLPAVLADFSTAHPGIRLTFLEELAVGFAERVRSGQAEVGLGLLLHPDDDLLFEPLLRDHLVVVLHGAHALASRASVSWRVLAKFSYISVTTQSSVRVHADQATAAAGLTLRPTYEVDSLTTAVALVRAGLGYAVLPSLALGSLDLGQAVARPIEQPKAWRTIGLLTRRQFSLSPAASAFAEVVRAKATAFAHAPSPGDPARRSLP
jgi:LysR family transcriptional regulator, carnitine catabolism transcriptional activator